MELVHGGLRFVCPTDVYHPAEDSYMLAGASCSLRGEILEIGCGCGIASLSCAKSSGGNSVLGIDINMGAVTASIANAKRNNIENASFLRSDLFSSLKMHGFDGIMFNPPYLPTSDDERVAGPLNMAFDGGEDGRKVLNRFLSSFDRYLKPGGILLLIQSTLNGEEETISSLREKGYDCMIAGEERFFFERISLVRAVKPQL